MSEENKIRDAADAMKGLLDTTPIYKDGLQESVQELGKGLHLVSQSVTSALKPLKALVWGAEKFEDWINHYVSKRLEKVPPEKIVTPPSNIAGPLLDSLRYCEDEDELKKLYGNLLSTSMNSTTRGRAHPAFVEMIKQLTPQEARIMKYISTSPRPFLPLVTIEMKRKSNHSAQDKDTSSIVAYRYYSRIPTDAGCSTDDNFPQYVDNLSRLGLVTVPVDTCYHDKKIYTPILEDPWLVDAVMKINTSNEHVAVIVLQYLMVTDLGDAFIDCCVAE